MRMCARRGTAGFVHVSCLAEQAKILVAEVEESKFGREGQDGEVEAAERAVCASNSTTASCFVRSDGLEEDTNGGGRGTGLGNGGALERLTDAKRHKEALSVYEACL